MQPTEDIHDLRVCDDFDDDCAKVLDPISCMKGDGLGCSPITGVCPEAQRRYYELETQNDT